jgi:hypothetical protein
VGRSGRRSRTIAPQLGESLEDLWADPGPGKAPSREVAQAGEGPSNGATETSSADARSLEIQAQIEADSRRIAWQQTYGKSQSGAPPIPALIKSPPRWRSFTPIGLNSPEKIQGVYAIVEITTERFYVGSSVDVVRRLSEHRAGLDAERHHARKLQQAWLVVGGNGFRYLLVERVHGPIKAVRDREQYWITELRAYPHGFNSKSTADGPEPSLYTQIDAAIKSRWQALYEPLAPRRIRYEANEEDRSAYNQNLKSLNIFALWLFWLYSLVPMMAWHFCGWESRVIYWL